MSFNALSFEYLLAPSTLRSIVKHTCQNVCRVLQPIYMPDQRNEEEWINIADTFYGRTNFLNVIGALDGKHIRIVRPDNSGSEYFNFKKYNSQVLMAWVDADYKFIFIEVGSLGLWPVSYTHLDVYKRQLQ